MQAWFTWIGNLVAIYFIIWNAIIYTRKRWNGNKFFCTIILYILLTPFKNKTNNDKAYLKRLREWKEKFNLNINYFISTFFLQIILIILSIFLYNYILGCSNYWNETFEQKLIYMCMSNIFKSKTNNKKFIGLSKILMQ